MKQEILEDLYRSAWSQVDAKEPEARHDQWLHKFADLIFKEIISEMESNKRCDPYTGEEYKNQYNAAIDEQIKILEECFGVDNERTNSRTDA